MRLNSPFTAFAITTALSALAISTPAFAGTPDKPAEPAADKPAAPSKTAELVKKGAASCEGGEIEDGLATLNAAWTQQKDVETAIALANCEMKAKDWPSAADHLAYALRSVAGGESRASLEKSFLAVRDRVGAVKVTVNVEGADVFVGDRYAGQSPLAGEVYVLPGTSRVSAKKPGFDETNTSVTVQARGTASVTLTLASEGTNPQHFRPSRSMTPAYVLGALGLVAGGAGAALYAAGASKGSAADAISSELGLATECGSSRGCKTVTSLRDGHDTLTRAGAGVMIGGGALLAAGVIYGLWASAPSFDNRASLRVTPVAGLGSGSLILSGRF